VNLDLTSDAAVLAVIPPGLMAGSTDFANERQYGVDPSGLHYLRFSSYDTQRYGPGANSRLISWFLPFAARDEAFARYCLYIESDVADGMVELGMKLPGLVSRILGGTNTNFSWRMEHGPVTAARGEYTLLDYRYDQDTGAGFGTIDPMGGAKLYAGRWHCIEQHAKVNTVGRHDGIGEVWLDGVKVWSRTDLNWRASASAQLNTLHVNVYHGGTTPPRSPMHYRIARVAVSSSYIGLPSELVGRLDPAWRVGMVKDHIYAIPNTANMSGVLASANGGDGLGLNIYDAWNGVAAGPDFIVSAAAGGHGVWQNVVTKLNLGLDHPTWTLEHAGSARSAARAAAYYTDGLPTSRHTYSTTQVSLGKVFAFSDNAPYGIGMGTPPFGGGYEVDGFDLTTKRWDAAGTNQSAPFSVDQTAVHPVTGDVYAGSLGRFWKWTRATRTFQEITPVFPRAIDSAQTQWQRKPGVIDVGRNRWAHLHRIGPTLQVMDLSTYAVTLIPITGPLASFGVYDYSALVFDEDNDRYITIQDSVGVGDAQRPVAVYAIDPTTGVSTQIGTAPFAAVNGVQNRLAYFRKLGGIAYLPKFDSDVLFMPTR
jgi:hypothetical protein